jgi:hypothetical protein
MLKEGLKAVGSISKAVKTKGAGDILKAGADTAKVISKAKKKSEKQKKKRKASNKMSV